LQSITQEWKGYNISKAIPVYQKSQPIKAFGEVATFEDFRGFYTCDGLTNQPMKFFVCDLYKHHFNELGVFKKSYQLGGKINWK